MELPRLFTFAPRQRRVIAIWLGAFVALTALALFLDFRFDSIWLKLWAFVSFLLALFFWNQYRKRLVRFVVDETSLVYSEPGWQFWKPPVKIQVFPYAESTLHIRWPRDKSNPLPSCAVVSDEYSIALPEVMPEYELLVAHLRKHVSLVDEDAAPQDGEELTPLESGATLRYGRVERGWLLLALTLVVAVLVFPGLRSRDSWFGYALEGVVQVVIVSFFASLLWILGPKLRVDSNGVVYRFLWRERVIRFEELEGVEFHNGSIWERMILRGGSTAISVYHPLSGYQSLVEFIEAKRPDCFHIPEVEFPWVISCRATSLWLQGLLLGIWTVLVCGVVYLINRDTGLWPLEWSCVLELAAGMAPALLVVGLHWMFRVRQFEFDEDRIAMTRKWSPVVHAVRDLLRIEHALKTMEYQRITFHLREGKGTFHLNASQVEIPLRIILKTLHRLYPATRQAEQIQRPEVDTEMETVDVG